MKYINSGRVAMVCALATAAVFPVAGQPGAPIQRGTPPPHYSSPSQYAPRTMYQGPHSGHQSVPTTRFSTVPDSRGPNYGGTAPYGRSRSASPGYGQPAVSPRYSPSAPELPQRSTRSRVHELEKLEPELPVEDRLKIPLIRTMYRQGEGMINEGQDSQDNSKVRYGTQRINEANERVKRLEEAQPPGGQSRDSNRGRGQERRRR